MKKLQKWEVGVKIEGHSIFWGGVALTVFEKERLRKKAEEAGKSINDYMHEAIFEGLKKKLA